MLFSSISFLYYFLPVVLAVYFIAPKKMKNGVLLLASLFFYAWGEPKYVLFMLLSILVGYVSGKLIEVHRNGKAGKIIFILSVMFDIGMLVCFKYADFLIENLNRATGASVSLLRLVLPVGISFYTFQILSYKVDLYRGEVAAQKNIVNLALYITMFPQLIAGPIVRYQTIETQIHTRNHSVANFAAGIRRFVPGLAKKVLIANTLGGLCEIFKDSEDKSVLFFWLYAAAFTLQIYFDFSGYSDMAIGLGRIFGFHFRENFDYPYISKSITEFWRRWHISLGAWFRDYVYIPLGGNRVSQKKWIRNVLVVWMLTGLWHGAEWNFLVWGLLFAVLLIIEKMWLGKFLQKGMLLNHIYVMCLVNISFVIFSAGDMGEAITYLTGMFGLAAYPLVSAEFLYYLRSNAVILCVAALGATPLPPMIVGRIASNKTGGRIVNVLEPVVLVALVVVVTGFLVDGSFNPFLYFRF